MSGKKIAIIFHEQDRKRPGHYAVTSLAHFWRTEGIDPVFVFGTKKVFPADLALVHVNLSVVPDEYLEYARDYPYALNGKVRDIRKSSFSQYRVRPDDPYEGKVIVKSNLNYAGKPERRTSGNASVWKRFIRKLASPDPAETRQLPCFESPLDYLIFDHRSLVPAEWFERSDIIVEKFLPEIRDGSYCIRNYYFLGDRGICVMKMGAHPIVNSATTTRIERVQVHPEMLSLRKTHYFDYGKYDYTLHEDVPVFLDMNKTPGTAHGSCPVDPLLHREWAAGILSYFTG